ncbi:alkylation response protein AidB-like acyl-CoA dehydrogenase [Methylopila capsulata]|uniref:Acyl-CoA dehydrogenase n=1 Tax=Methylopila capsulata TaxID=61654 RepID=A0A9W6ITR1_9HYPH|nr:acyl-CoA dehydrogenase family protein [Methylopila capsulata]MBM7850185.1 alkylation response protein AidB-like acyl-CoA dehydrogenase [Methylopila capsulata]GLK55477.1 acyl-CoA dehydrogenase [Methylopila capsulata]
MPIDFTLTAAQLRLRAVAREFANDILAPVVRAADEDPDPQSAFVRVKGAYVEAYKLGFATGFIPKRYGGGGASNLDLQVISEEICAVDPGFATVLLVNGLALMPLVWFGSEEQKRKWLPPASADPRGEYLAGWTVSEAAGAPGGTANFDSPAPYPAGVSLTATHDARNGEYVLNGEKYWPCNSGGWDLEGANVNVCIVRTAPEQGGASGLSAILVPRGTAGVSYAQPISKIGHRVCQNNHIRFENCRVPEENAFAVGHGDLCINRAFTWSGPVAAIAAVGVARSAYEYALDWAKTHTAGGDGPIMRHQAVGYALADVAMRIEACRAFSWKAAHYQDLNDSEGHAIGAMAKVFCGETLFDAVFKTMRIMGVNALDRRHPLERYLREAAVFPLYDAGNLGMQMRKIWQVMANPDFDPRALMESRLTPFEKVWPPRP